MIFSVDCSTLGYAQGTQGTAPGSGKGFGHSTGAVLGAAHSSSLGAHYAPGDYSPQKYSLEVFDASRGKRLLHYADQPFPVFAVHGLSASQDYVFVVTARNDAGRSKESVLTTAPAESLVLKSRAYLDGKNISE